MNEQEGDASGRVSGDAAAARVHADEIEEFARLFLRRASIDRGTSGTDSASAILAAMSRLARRVQRDLDALGDEYGLVHLAQGDVGSPQRELTLTYLLMSAPLMDYGPVADEMLERLDRAARQFRAGAVRDDRGRRRRSRRMRRRTQRVALFGGLTFAVALVYAAGLGLCGSWEVRREAIGLPSTMTPRASSTVAA